MVNLLNIYGDFMKFFKFEIIYLLLIYGVCCFGSVANPSFYDLSQIDGIQDFAIDTTVTGDAYFYQSGVGADYSRLPVAVVVTVVDKIIDKNLGPYFLVDNVGVTTYYVFQGFFSKYFGRTNELEAQSFSWPDVLMQYDGVHPLEQDFSYSFTSFGPQSDHPYPPESSVIGAGPDSDGDGFSDSAEEACGADPNDPHNWPAPGGDGESSWGPNGGIDNDGNPLPNSGPNDDYDGDGLANNIENNMGGFPVSAGDGFPSGGSTPDVSVDGQNPADVNDGGELPGANADPDVNDSSEGGGLPDYNINPWFSLPNGTYIVDVSTGRCFGTVYDDGITKKVHTYANDWTLYKTPLSDWSNIPIKGRVLKPGDPPYWVVYVDGKNGSAGIVNDDSNLPVDPPPFIPPASGGGNVTTVNNDNSTTNNITNINAEAPDMSGVEGRLDQINNKLDEMFDAPELTDYEGGDTSFDPDSFSDVLESIKSNFTARKDSLSAKVPSFLKGDFLPDSVQTAEIPHIQIDFLNIDVPIWPEDKTNIRLMIRDFFKFLLYVFLLYVLWKVLAGGN